ncbi:Uncharacterised protein [Mycobacteroides abscessus subsp. abscessus]|nr:Uncharacterised protein [Mycobacteroides abscessus subsp. abscessus]
MAGATKSIGVATWLIIGEHDRQQIDRLIGGAFTTGSQPSMHRCFRSAEPDTIGSALALNSSQTSYQKGIPR